MNYIKEITLLVEKWIVLFDTQQRNSIAAPTAINLLYFNSYSKVNYTIKIYFLHLK